MGLDTSHNAYHGSYGSFNDLRREILKAYNGVDLFTTKEYDGIRRHDETIVNTGKSLVDLIDSNGILLLMNHSDCDGEISWVDCELVANALLPLSGNLSSFRNLLLEDFIKGCQLAYESKENLEFR